MSAEHPGPDPAPRHRDLSRVLPSCFGVAGLVVGVVLLWGQHLPLMARGASIGLIASVVCGVAAAVAYPVERARANRRPELAWRRHQPTTRWHLDVVVLTLAHALIAWLLCLGVFGLFQQGFYDLTLDPVAGALLIMVAAFVAAVLAQYSATITSTVHLASVLITMLATGCIGAMLIARDSTWWQRDFSQLGGMGSFGALTLNVTLVLSGIAVVVLVDYLDHDLRRHAAQVRPGGRRLLRWLLGGAGVLMVLIGAIPVSTSRPVHVAFAMAMALTLVLLMALTPIKVLGLDRGFVWASGGAVGIVVAAIFLSRVVGYFTWTAVEVVSATVIFSWVTVFVRRVAALDGHPAPAVEGGGTSDAAVGDAAVEARERGGAAVGGRDGAAAGGGTSAGERGGAAAGGRDGAAASRRDGAPASRRDGAPAGKSAQGAAAQGAAAQPDPSHRNAARH
ncbi:hypothetical protein [Naumannella huperziae]